jgi:hypothetical protein
MFGPKLMVALLILAAGYMTGRWAGGIPFPQREVRIVAA